MFNFNYDPQRQGYDPGVWKTVAGTPSISGNNLLLNAAGIVQLADCFRGTFNFKLTLPSTPANGYLTGGTSATAVAATWAAVTDGEFSVTIDGTAYDITGIDFTGATDMDAVATILQTAIRNATSGLETVEWDTDHFIITGRTQVSVTSAVSGGSGTDISGVGATTFLDCEAGVGTATAGTSKVIGLTSLNKGIKAVFHIYGGELRCITLDEDGVTNTAIIPWVSAWSSSPALFQVRWYGTSVAFYVNETQVASFNENIPNSSMSEYLYNYNSDNLIVVYTEGINIDTYVRSQINVNVNVSDVELGAVELKDGATDTRATVGTLGSTTGLNVAIVDDAGEQITSFGSPSTIAEFKSPSDFTATYTSNVTITLSALPFTITDSSQLVYIKVIPSTGDAQVLVNGSGGVTMTVSSNVVTVSGAGTPFASGDVYEVGINDQDKAFDASTNSLMTSPLKNVWNQYTDPEVLVTSQDLTASYADFGAEIDMRGYTHLRVGIVLDVNDSTGITLKLLGLDKSGGSDEYEIEGGTTQAIADTADAKYSYEFDVKGSPFIQLQAIAGTVGATAGDLTLNVSKMFKN